MTGSKIFSLENLKAESQTEDLKLKTLELRDKPKVMRAQEEANALRQEAEAHAEERNLDQQKSQICRTSSGRRSRLF